MSKAQEKSGEPPPPGEVAVRGRKPEWPARAEQDPASPCGSGPAPRRVAHGCGGRGSHLQVGQNVLPLSWPACSAGTRAFQSRTSQTHDLSHMQAHCGPRAHGGGPAGTPSPRATRAKGNNYYSGLLALGGGGVAQRGWVMGQVFLSMYFTSIRVLLDISTYTWEHRTKSRGTAGGCQQEREHTHHRTPQAPGVEAANTTKHAGGHGPPPQLHPACAHSPAWTAAAEQHGDERRDT